MENKIKIKQMENTEKLVITSLFDKKNPTLYKNTRLGFIGTIEGAKVFAENHNFKGGVEIIKRVRGKLTFQKVS